MNNRQTILDACALIEAGKYVEGTEMIIPPMWRLTDLDLPEILESEIYRRVGKSKPYIDWMFSAEGKTLIDNIHKRLRNDTALPQTS